MLILYGSRKTRASAILRQVPGEPPHHLPVHPLPHIIGHGVVGMIICHVAQSLRRAHVIGHQRPMEITRCLWRDTPVRARHLRQQRRREESLRVEVRTLRPW